MRKLFALLLVLQLFPLFAQEDPDFLRNLYDLSLTNGRSYSWLDHLSNEIGGRLSGSENAARAVAYTYEELQHLGLDKVWLQPVMVPKWVRGEKETGHYFHSGGQRVELNICALGGSVATPPDGITAEVIEVQGLEELEKLGKDSVHGKIVFFNRRFDDKLIETFRAYGGCVDQRHRGALVAGKLGAAGVIVRSMTHSLDDYPHTGSMTYEDLPESLRIPAAAISTNDAEALSQRLKENARIQLTFRQSCKQYEDVESFNVIGEITGAEFPEEFILVGGHLDSWDLGDGSHDDGAGVVQSMEVLRLLKISGHKPKRSIRVVLFMNEENGLRGGRKYAEESALKGERHVFALESDSGGFTPRGFSFDCGEEDFRKFKSWEPLFEPYLIHLFEKGGSGADIGPLKTEGLVLAGLRPDSQRYFDHHHTAIDNFAAVNKRELELGAATMASLVYLIDKYGTAASSELELRQ